VLRWRPSWPTSHSASCPSVPTQRAGRSHHGGPGQDLATLRPDRQRAAGPPADRLPTITTGASTTDGRVPSRRHSRSLRHHMAHLVAPDHITHGGAHDREGVIRSWPAGIRGRRRRGHYSWGYRAPSLPSAAAKRLKAGAYVRRIDPGSIPSRRLCGGCARQPRYVARP
jgi:hypothetical protein